MCFFGSMRASELMIDQKEGFNLSQHLGLDVVTDSLAHPTMVQITLKKSKMDPFRKGMTHSFGSYEKQTLPCTAPLHIKEELSPLLMHRDIARP